MAEEVKTICDDAVLEAIAKRFPDGFDFDSDDDMGDNWANVIADELGTFESGFSHQAPVIAAVRRLMCNGRLRTVWDGMNWIALSYTEQARRILAILPIDDKRDEYEERIVDVLAGKTEKS